MLKPSSCRGVAEGFPSPSPRPSGFGAWQLLAHPGKDQTGGTSTSITPRGARHGRARALAPGQSHRRAGWHPGPGWGLSPRGRRHPWGWGSAEAKVGAKAEGDRTNTEMFYVGNEPWGMSGHGLRRTHGTKWDSLGNWLGMTPAPISTGLTALCTGTGSATQGLSPVSHATQQHHGRGRLCSPDTAAAAGPAKPTPSPGPGSRDGCWC